MGVNIYHIPSYLFLYCMQESVCHHVIAALLTEIVLCSVGLFDRLTPLIRLLKPFHLLSGTSNCLAAGPTYSNKTILYL